jgi:tetratricopeptide (TPR) repeat protein
MPNPQPLSPIESSKSSGLLVQDGSRFRIKFYLLWAWWHLCLLVVPRSSSARFHLGNAYAAKGMEEQAIKNWKRCVEQEPGHAKAWHNLAALYMQKERWSEAMQAFAQLRRLHPAQAEHAFHYGRCLEEAGQVSEALQAYEQALEQAPEQIEWRYAVAKSLLRHKRLKEAAEHLRHIVAVREDHVGAYEHLGKIYLALKKYEAAERMFQKALAHAEHPDPLYYVLGMVAERRGQVEEARAYYERITALNLVTEAKKRLEAIRQEQAKAQTEQMQG